jgi:hypothetical protein
LRTGLVRRRARVGDDALAVDAEDEAEAVGLGVGGQLWGARRADVEYEVEAGAGADDDVAGGLEYLQAGWVLGGRHAQCGEAVGADQRAVAEKGDVTVG